MCVWLPQPMYLLDQAVHAGTFREDLFYRLDVIRMNIPPLRERQEDILFLFGHFTKQLGKHYGLEPPTFSDSFIDALLAYNWPGNVRQLENFSERLVLARPRRVLKARDFDKLRTTSLAESGHQVLGQEKPGWHTAVDISKTLGANMTPAVEQLEREYLQAVLKHHGVAWPPQPTRLGLVVARCCCKLHLYNIDKRDFKS